MSFKQENKLKEMRDTSLRVEIYSKKTVQFMSIEQRDVVEYEVFILIITFIEVFLLH